MSPTVHKLLSFDHNNNASQEYVIDMPNLQIIEHKSNLDYDLHTFRDRCPNDMTNLIENRVIIKLKLHVNKSHLLPDKMETTLI